MPTVTNPNLTLTESEGRVTIRVRADVTFSSVERQFSGLGMDWHPHITVHDFDGPRTDPGAQLFEFLTGTDRLADFAVTVGSGSQVLPIDGVADRGPRGAEGGSGEQRRRDQGEDPDPHKRRPGRKHARRADRPGDSPD